MGSNKQQMKFESFKGNHLISRYDPATHERLNGQWLDNAFTWIYVVKPLVSNKKASIHSMIVKGFNAGVDLSDDYLVEQLMTAGLKLVKFNKKTNSPTLIAKLTTSERQS